MGLILEPSALIFLLHRPLFLPWAEITDFRYEEKIFKKVIFKIAKRRIAVYGNVAKPIFETYVKWKNGQLN